MRKSTGFLNSNATRDRRIDFWRGLCLIDMVLVHLYYEPNVQLGALGPWLGEYTRFAAGGFVFMAGMAMGAIFRPKAAQPERKGEIYRRLWQRSLRLMGWQYLVAIAWILLELYRGQRDPITPMQFIVGVLTLREGGDLLPLYVVLVALAPLLIEVSLRRFGWLILFACSIALFVFGRFHPFAISIDPRGNFPPVLWQLVFLTGLLSGSLLSAYDRLSVRVKAIMGACAWTACGLLFWCEYWKTFNLPPCPVSLVFTKVPLTTGELLRYFSIVFSLLITTDLLWTRILNMRWVSFAATLGRSTLPVYVVHTFLIELAGYLAGKWFWMGQWQLAFIPATLALLWVLALAIQWRRPARAPKVAAPTWPVFLAPANEPAN